VESTEKINARKSEYSKKKKRKQKVKENVRGLLVWF